jgi:TetR/AcrR family transcriptional regulator
MVKPAHRTPPDARRVRDADRTRHALLDAARDEFAAKGLEGARVSSIADRAGVNKQLISYYFGGKQGLYDAMVEEWLDYERSIQSPEIDLAELACRYLKVVHEQPSLHTVFIRENLTASTDDLRVEPDSDDMVEMKRRQALGEIPEDIDPAFLLLMLQAMVSASAVFPGDVKRHLGLDPHSDEFFELAETQLRIIIPRMLGG